MRPASQSSETLSAQAASVAPSSSIDDLFLSTWETIVASYLRPSLLAKFGITDYIGVGRAHHGRLGVRLCSTPFGITDYIGLYQSYI